MKSVDAEIKQTLSRSLRHSMKLENIDEDSDLNFTDDVRKWYGHEFHIQFLCNYFSPIVIITLTAKLFSSFLSLYFFIASIILYSRILLMTKMNWWTWLQVYRWWWKMNPKNLILTQKIMWVTNNLEIYWFLFSFFLYLFVSQEGFIPFQIASFNNLEIYWLLFSFFLYLFVSQEGFTPFQIASFNNDIDTMKSIAQFPGFKFSSRDYVSVHCNSISCSALLSFRSLLSPLYFNY